MTDTTIDTTEKTSATTKIRYIRDEDNEQRVLTIATKLEGDTMSFAWSMNSPKCDRFQRKLGSKIAKGRLTSGHAVHTKVNPGMHPYLVVLQALTTNEESRTVSRIALQEMRRLELQWSKAVRGGGLESRAAAAE